MAKADIVSQGVADLQSAEAQVKTDFLGAYYDKVAADVGAAPAPVGFTQEEVDAKIADAVAAAKAEMQAKIDEIAAKELAEEQKLEAIKALLA